MVEQKRVARALQIINDSPPSYQETCMWQILNWLYWLSKEKTRQPKAPTDKEEKENSNLSRAR